jgi:UDP-N-acetylenolpyruvoylglucosamine reductase
MSYPESIVGDLQSCLDEGGLLLCREPLAKRTTLRVGGRADFLAEPATEAELVRLVQYCGTAQLPCRVIGRGSNLLIGDGGVRGLVICLAHRHFSRVKVRDDVLCCGAGARLKEVAGVACKMNLAGLEFMEGIPGSVGGALRMNAGAMGAWVFDVVERVRYLDAAGLVHDIPGSDAGARYRCCPLLVSNIALGAVFKGSPSLSAEIRRKMDEYSLSRWQRQPREPSAGCAFKNPEGIPAGRLIDELGLKGMRVGGAVVSQVHANFLVNDGSATAADFFALIRLIKTRARQERGIELETEIETMGEQAGFPV